MAVGLSFPTLATRWRAVPVVPLALLGVAIVLSSHRLVAAPGFEPILAPFAYLPALRWYGVRIAIAVDDRMVMVLDLRCMAIDTDALLADAA